MPPNQQNQNPYNQAPQPNAQGGYDVVPPLPGAPNAGHSGHNPYEFIVNPQKPARHGPLGGNFSALKALLVVVGILVVLAIFTAVLLSLFAPKGPIAGLTAIAQRQQEIVRIATDGTQNAQGQDVKNFVANVEASVSSDQAQVTNYLNSHHTKLKDKVLALDQSAQTDDLLSNAQASNTYDSAVVSNLSDQLTTYQGMLQSTYKDTGNADLKQTLQHGYEAVALLLMQAKNIQSPSS